MISTFADSTEGKSGMISCPNLEFTILFDFMQSTGQNRKTICYNFSNELEKLKMISYNFSQIQLKM